MSASDCGPASCDIKKCGHMVWDYIHFVAGVYSNTGGSEARQWIAEALGKIHLMVPCGNCSLHAKQNAASFELLKKAKKAVEAPHAPESPDSLFAVTVEFHNEVNRMLGKPVWSLERASRRFKPCFRQSCSLKKGCGTNTGLAPGDMERALAIFFGCGWGLTVLGVAVYFVASKRKN